ncbi:MAG: NAD-dependent epimerase/dehydratase family protein [Pirellulales bacterium]|nr:NAD-dependent epimerase/dehydratase family protein [Pirellulales bacterium]
MAKVLITGASGFIGWHLAEALLACGDEVACLVRKTSRVDRLRTLGVRLAYGDVTDPDSLPAAIADCRTVYHVAGCTHALHSRRFYEVNQQGTRNVARACAQVSSSPVLVLVSSLAAVGPAPEGRMRIESDPPDPVSHYGRSKRAGERMAAEFADRVPTTIVRPPIVLGEGDRKGLDMFRLIDRFGVHVVPALGRERYSVIHAADLARLLILAAERGTRLAPGGLDAPAPRKGTYFAACNEHPTYAELGRMIAVALGRRRVAIVPTPPRAAWVVAAANELVSRLSRRSRYLNFDKTREIRAGSWLCSPQAAVDELEFSVAASLAQRLNQTVQWYRREGWLRAARAAEPSEVETVRPFDEATTGRLPKDTATGSRT